MRTEWGMQNLKMQGALDGLFGGGDAAEDAAEAQIAAQQEAIAEQRRQFDVTQQLLDPFRSGGVTALNEMLLLMGLSPGAAAPTGPQLTEDQIRQNLIASGQFNRAGTADPNAVFTDPVSGKSVFIDPRAFSDNPGGRAQLQRKIANEKRAAERFMAKTRGKGTIAEFVRLHLDPDDRDFFIRDTPLGGLDEAGLNAAIQRQLAQQGAAGTAPGQSQQDAIARLVDLPGQQFIRDRAQQALLRQTSAIGGLGGGEVRSALVEQGAGFAAQDLQNRYSRLQNLITGGQAAAAGTGAAAQQTGGNIAQLLASGGQARAQGILGAQQANAGLAGTLGTAGLGAAAGAGLAGPALAQAFGGSGLAGAIMALASDVNLKTDIRDLTPKECFDLVQMLDIKAWRYLPETGLGNTMHVGPMAQDAPEIIKMPMEEKLNLHSELMLIAGALQYINEISLLDEFDEGEATCQ